MKNLSELLKYSKYLSVARYVLHVFDGKENFNNPQSVFIEFDSTVGITIRCGSDGETMLLEEGSLNFVERDMGEFGKEVVKDVININPWKKACNSPMEHIFGIKSDGFIIGYRFSFEVLEINIVNFGDEIFIYEYFPEKIIIDERIVFENIINI